MFIGIDIGSISTKIVVINDMDNIIFTEYLLNRGNPIEAVTNIIKKTRGINLHKYLSLCTTGSGRKYIGNLLQTDIIKNEITTTWKAAVTILPEVKTIIDIGGQDSKLITIENGDISNFKLNSLCAAGTGAFIEQQANRLGIPMGKLSEIALQTDKKAKFTGRCTVFVETEMINLQQTGYPVEAIAAGLIDAVCENILNDLTPGIRIIKPIIFCGGVSQIKAIRQVLAKRIGIKIVLPDYNKTMAAYGAALLAKEIFYNKKKDRIYNELSINNNKMYMNRPAYCNNSDCLNCGLCYKKK